jgi:cobalt transporter subunit CbtB
MSISTHTPALIRNRHWLRKIIAAWPSLGAAMLGIAIVYLVGFAGAHTIHAAAHDARHSLNFPCH